MHRILATATCLAAFLALGACGGRKNSTVDDLMAQDEAASAAVSSGVVRVSDRRLVCMVNDQVMPVPLLPVEVGGRVYYACCPNCEGRLARDASVRTARDPVSGDMVDKADAIIARVRGGGVVYFASEANFLAYQSGNTGG